MLAPRPGEPRRQLIPRSGVSKGVVRQYFERNNSRGRFSREGRRAEIESTRGRSRGGAFAGACGEEDGPRPDDQEVEHGEAQRAIGP